MKTFVLLLLVIGTRSNTVRSTPIRNEVSEKVLAWMNTSANPCDSFHEFSCGRFGDTVKLSENKTLVTVLKQITENFDVQMKKLIEEPIKETELNLIKSAKMLYKSCMNTERIEKSSLIDFKDLIVKLGGWPVLNNWIENDFEWHKLHYKMVEIGIETDDIIDIIVTGDMDDPNLNILVIDRPSFGIGYDALKRGKEDHLVKAYYKYMVEIAILLGADKKTAETEMAQVVDLEIRLAKATLSQADRLTKSITNNKYTIAQLNKVFPIINWLEYLKEILMNRVELDNTEVVVVMELQYIKTLMEELKNTPKRVLANYLMWQTVMTIIPVLNQEAILKFNEFMPSLGVEPSDEERWRNCLTGTIDKLPISAGSMYARQYFDLESKAAVAEIVDLVQAEFTKSLEEADWMDEATKKTSLAKAKGIKKIIGYSDDILDDTKMEMEFKDLEINDDQYMFAQINISKFDTMKEYDSLRRPVNETDGFQNLYVANTNREYEPSTNTIEYSASVLQGHFFYNIRPKYMNFGSFGYQLASGFTFRWNTDGKDFDIDGNQKHWWSEESKIAFKRKLDSIRKKIEEHHKDIKHPEKDRLDMLIFTTNTSLKETYNAYKAWMTQHGAEPKLPGLDYTSEQLFWISLCQGICYITSDESLDVLYKFSVEGPLSNSVEFATDWNCPSGSKMNPIAKTV